MTLTIDLTPTEEAQFNALAQQRGTAPAELVKTLVQEQLPTISYREQEQVLVLEYQVLTGLEREGRLSPKQAQRRREVETALDELEAQDPAEQEAERRLRATSDKLDEILTLLRSLPRKDADQ